MVNPASSVQPGPMNRSIVAFDFDGTLTIRDSYLDFLHWRAGPLGRAIGWVRLGPATVAYLVDRDRQRIKEAATRVFLGGAPFADVGKDAERYRDAAWSRLMRPDALDRWRRWKDAGAMMVIVTASPEVEIAPFARTLGADLLIGTRLALDAAGRVNGRFNGLNCRGAEKVRRLREVFGPDLRLTAAYGDSDGDYEMLDLARERGLKVFTGKPGD